MRESKDPESITYMRGRLECLDPKLFRQLNVTSACVTKVKVDLPSIIYYVRLLKWLNANDLSAERIDLKSANVRAQTVTIENFFRDSLGRYVDSEQEVTTFKHEALSLLKRFEGLEHEQIGDIGYNVRLLRVLLFSVATLADNLRLFSLQRS
jgi:hypothetical protein